MRHPALFAVVLVVLLSGCASSGRHAKAGHTQRGMASWYGEPFHGRPTASGAIYDMHGLTAAHKQLPLGTVIDVVNLDNGREVRVEVNDRGPFVRGRILDLSMGAARRLGMVEKGLARVEIRVVERGRGRLPADAFTVQLGAFRQRANADKLVDELRADYPEITVRTGEDGIHRVQIGAWPEASDAAAVRRELVRRGYAAAVVGLR